MFKEMLASIDGRVEDTVEMERHNKLRISLQEAEADLNLCELMLSFESHTVGYAQQAVRRCQTYMELCQAQQMEFELERANHV